MTAKTICLQKYETSTTIYTLRFQSGIRYVEVARTTSTAVLDWDKSAI